jgi:hypothetical protein
VQEGEEQVFWRSMIESLLEGTPGGAPVAKRIAGDR